MTTTWETEWMTITKGQEFTCDYFDYNGATKEMTGLVDYVLQNSWYTLITLTNGFEYVLYTKKYLNANNIKSFKN
tara:strand:+ start:6224 stop:6448 length:225 start_codon:yes stop_codon:yes gene_type:complete